MFWSMSYRIGNGFCRQHFEVYETYDAGLPLSCLPRVLGDRV